MSNLSGLFDDVNTQVGNIAQQVGTKPSSFEPRVFAMIEALSRNVVLPIAGIILTFIACYELIEMITQHNNMAQFEPALIMRWIFKTAISVWLISNTFDIVMAVFDLTQKVVSDSSGIIAGNTRVNDIGLSMLQSSLMQMDVGPLFGLFLQSFFIGITMRILSIIIFVIVYTMYFERNGGYEYAKQFYEEAYHFIEEKFGADNVISAVMHADEINVAASEELGKEVYHYHLHAMVLPVVEKEILWSKRCKDPELRGTVKEVVNQISHSKKWKSDIPLTDEKGNPLLRKNGKPMFRASYSILQDELFHYMTEQGFKGFQRGEYGSTAEHLTSLQYQIKQDKERLEKLQKRIQKEQVKYEPARHISKTLNEIDSMGQKTITGKMAISKEDYSQLTALAKEGITSRAEIKKFEQSANFYRQKYMDSANALERMKTKYNELKEKCRPFLEALEHFPEVAKLFTEKVKQLFSFKEAQERAEKEAREKERQERIKARKSKRDMER